MTGRIISPSTISCMRTTTSTIQIRNIVLMRPVNSMIEFKQIIGRGTRLYDGKDYFTIYDFVHAYHHFNDPDPQHRADAAGQFDDRVQADHRARHAVV